MAHCEGGGVIARLSSIINCPSNQYEGIEASLPPGGDCFCRQCVMEDILLLRHAGREILGKKGPTRHKPWPIHKVIYCQGSCTLSRQLRTVKTVAESQDNCTLSRHLQKVKTVAKSQDNCILSRHLQKVNTVAESQDSFRK